MHQSLHHFSQFLGRISLPLAQLFQDKTKRKNEWFVLQSRHGKKEKMRGQLQLDIQFLQISSPSNGPSLSSRGGWSLFTRFCDSRKGSKYKAYKETQSHSSSMTNEEDSSSSSVNTELEISTAKSGPKLGDSLPIVAAALAGRKPASTIQLQKLTSHNYKDLSSEAMNLADCSSQSEHPVTLEQFSSIFTLPPNKKSKPLKEERSPEAAGIAMEPWQPSLLLRAAGPSEIPPQAQTLHLSTVSLHQTTSSTTSRFRRCQLRLHRSYHSCLRCFGLGS
ncbi:rab11 family-interacting protein 2-like [Sphaerodactylus townsendi]|uniref:rab11 family-interacting protein 2-like n=1 Tax=Sphaerodactylus townsendi TaxID=933632 RepID=UPI002025D56B|nr:rab11 family-interacting protein 2-like [Sphaerodactylus townsendi]